MPVPAPRPAVPGGDRAGLLADWAPTAADRATILVASAERLFFAD